MSSISNGSRGCPKACVTWRRGTRRFCPPRISPRALRRPSPSVRRSSAGSELITWLLLAVAIAVEVAATLSLRAAEGFTRLGWTIPVVLGYATSFVLLAFVLKRGMPVGVAYGVWAGIGVAATAIL